MEKVTHQLPLGSPSDSSKRSGRAAPETALAELKSFAEYEPTKGGFILTKQRRSSKISVGSYIGCMVGKLGNQYLAIRLLGRLEMIHTLVWLWHYGVWPSYEIDHIDQDQMNNKIDNLRCVERKINGRNKRKQTNNTTGFTGVYRHNDKFQASVRVDTISRTIGTFETAEEADKARKEFLLSNPHLGFTELHGK